MSSPGQRRGGCGQVMARFDQHSFCARCREKYKGGGNPCVEKKDTSQSKFCLALTPEQLAQILTPSYKLKKEKREAKKPESATRSKELSELVDPASVSVIGVVGQSTSDKSPATSSSLPPEKKIMKDKTTSKAKKSSDSTELESKKTDSTDTKIAELDSKWSERFNRLEACFYLEPCSRPSLLRSEFHPLTLRLTFRKILSLFSNLQGALARTPLQKCISQPASRSWILSLLLQSALARVSLLPSINQPASSHPTDRSHLLQHLSALARVHLQLCINQPASLSPTGRLLDPLIGALVPTRLFPNSNIPASLSRARTDLQCLAILLPTLLTKIFQARQTDQYLPAHLL